MEARHLERVARVEVEVEVEVDVDRRLDLDERPKCGCDAARGYNRSSSGQVVGPRWPLAGAILRLMEA